MPVIFHLLWTLVSIIVSGTVLLLECTNRRLACIHWSTLMNLNVIVHPLGPLNESRDLFVMVDISELFPPSASASASTHFIELIVKQCFCFSFPFFFYDFLWDVYIKYVNGVKIYCLLQITLKWRIDFLSFFTLLITNYHPFLSEKDWYSNDKVSCNLFMNADTPSFNFHSLTGTRSLHFKRAINFDLLLNANSVLVRTFYWHVPKYLRRLSNSL